MDKIGYSDVGQYKKYLIDGLELLEGKYYRGEIDQSIFKVKICNSISDITDDTVVCVGDLDLRGYCHPLPSGFTHCGGYLYLRGYEHPLPSGFTHCGGYLDLEGYSHPLPEGFTHCGDLYLEGYEHPLPEGFTANKK